ncbi:MAG: DUF805 domain-containing protein [Hyphomicrobium sp.]|uniref:DUF805 domain-containing protein n=1 Tax=Hyphomicrobium sp. TaxID=82 RepID=UPI003D132B59
MADTVIDLFFSFQGRVDRRAWWIGAAIIAVVGLAGLYLFNNDGFDESANASREALTMGAFLWLMLCLFALTALSAKRLKDCGQPRLLYTLGIAGVLLISGRAFGLFTGVLSDAPDTAVFWGLLALAAPGIAACAALPTQEGR